MPQSYDTHPQDKHVEFVHHIRTPKTFHKSSALALLLLERSSMCYHNNVIGVSLMVNQDLSKAAPILCSKKVKLICSKQMAP